MIHYRDEQSSSVITDFTAEDNKYLFKFKQKLTSKTGNDGTIDVEIHYFKYLTIKYFLENP